MAVEWAPIDVNLRQKPEFHRVVTATSVDPELVFSRIVQFWLWVQVHAKEDPGQRGWGLLPGVSATDLARECGGTAEFWTAFANAAPEWLRWERRGACIPGFDQRFSKAAKRRLEDRERKREARASAKADGATEEAPAAAASAETAAAKHVGKLFAEVDNEMLFRVATVVAWGRRAARAGVSGLDDSKASHRTLIAAAIYSRRADKPAAMFVRIVKHRSWDWVGDKDRNLATVEYRAFEQELERHRQMTDSRLEQIMKRTEAPAEGMVIPLKKQHA